MAKFLQDRQIQNQTKIHFDVLDVTWYEDTTFYLCRFRIKMTMPDGHDTTGDMMKKIPKDFTAVLAPN